MEGRGYVLYQPCLRLHNLIGYVSADFNPPYLSYFHMLSIFANVSNTLNLSRDVLSYIEQIAVKPGYSRMGIGSKLITKSKEIKPNGLIADVFIQPVKNQSSVLFFSSQDFFPFGILFQYPIAHVYFPYAHQTQVFFWNPDFQLASNPPHYFNL